MDKGPKKREGPTPPRFGESGPVEVYGGPWSLPKIRNRDGSGIPRGTWWNPDSGGDWEGWA